MADFLIYIYYEISVDKNDQVTSMTMPVSTSAIFAASQCLSELWFFRVWWACFKYPTGSRTQKC